MSLAFLGALPWNNAFCSVQKTSLTWSLGGRQFSVGAGGPLCEADYSIFG